jgi:hypothetical protein
MFKAGGKAGVVIKWWRMKEHLRIKSGALPAISMSFSDISNLYVKRKG